MQKVLIIGASGFLGAKLYDFYSLNSDYQVYGTCNTSSTAGLIKLDITKRDSVYKLMREIRPDVVIHTVALSDPDLCEKNKEKAEEINYFGTTYVVGGCIEVGARLDYISTVYVFDGVHGNYSETDTPNPINWYGETKLRAEMEVAQLNSYGIYRFDKLYGFNPGLRRSNDVFSKLAKGNTFQVNSDQIRQPLLIDDVCRALQLVQKRNENGIIHLAGPDRCTKYELSLRLAKLVEKGDLVLPIAEVEQLARRPRDASISTTKIESFGMVFTPLETALSLIQESLNKRDVEGRRRGVEF